jgi:Mg/Co/Ni transporter MgtE
LESVQDFFADLSFSPFSGLENGIYIGSISGDDVETFDSEKKILDYRYTLEGFYARKNMIWLDLLEIFARNHTSIVPVLDEKNNYIGYYDITDIIKFFHETPFLKEWEELL